MKNLAPVKPAAVQTKGSIDPRLIYMALGLLIVAAAVVLIIRQRKSALGASGASPVALPGPAVVPVPAAAAGAA